MASYSHDERLADLRFVLGEVVRLSRMTADEYREERRTTSPRFPLPWFTLPDGKGVRPYSVAARQRLARLSDAAFRQKGLSGKIEKEDFSLEFEKEVARSFILKRSNVTLQNLDRAVNRAHDRATDKLVRLTHFLPCLLFHSRDLHSFVIGPVEFHRTDVIVPELKWYLAKQGSDQPLPASQSEAGQILLQKFLLYAANFNWIGRVTIDPCAPPISRKMAIRAVDAAVDVLRVMVGSRAEGFVVGVPESKAVRRSFAIDADSGRTFPAASYNFPESLSSEWWSKVNSGDNAERVRTCGKAISALTLPGAKLPPLSERLIDSCWWFGQAVQDPVPGSRIIKFVVGIERLVMTGKPSGGEDAERITATVKRRVGSICSGPKADDVMVDYWSREMGDVYKARSGVTHGTDSPFSQRSSKMASRAEAITRELLLRCMEIFQLIGIDRPNYKDSQLSDAYDYIEARNVELRAQRD